MAFKTITVNECPVYSNTKEYLCQTADDIKKLPRYGVFGIQDGDNDDNEPCAYGSTAVVVSTADVYILAPDNTWVIFGGEAE